MRDRAARLLYRIAMRLDPNEPILYTTRSARRIDADYAAVIVDAIAHIPEHPPRNLTPGSGTLFRY